MKSKQLMLIITVLLVLVSFQNCSIVAPPTAQEMKGSSSLSSQELLEVKAFKVINAKCAGCHNPTSPMGGIDYITNLDGLLYYRLVVPGEPALSDLYQVIVSGQMPPGKPLATSEVQDVYNWILEGFKDGVGGVTPPPVTPPATLMPTFTSINNLILKTKCLGCHNSNNPQGGVSYSTYASTRNTVQPGNPNASSLYTSVTTGNMPRGGARLSANETMVIQTWITNNALNN